MLTHRVMFFIGSLFLSCPVMDCETTEFVVNEPIDDFARYQELIQKLNETSFEGYSRGIINTEEFVRIARLSNRLLLRASNTLHDTTLNSNQQNDLLSKAVAYDEARLKKEAIASWQLDMVKSEFLRWQAQDALDSKNQQKQREFLMEAKACAENAAESIELMEDAGIIRSKDTKRDALVRLHEIRYELARCQAERSAIEATFKDLRDAHHNYYEKVKVRYEMGIQSIVDLKDAEAAKAFADYRLAQHLGQFAMSKAALVQAENAAAVVFDSRKELLQAPARGDAKDGFFEYIDIALRLAEIQIAIADGNHDRLGRFRAYRQCNEALEVACSNATYRGAVCSPYAECQRSIIRLDSKIPEEAIIHKSESNDPEGSKRYRFQNDEWYLSPTGTLHVLINQKWVTVDSEK